MNRKSEERREIFQNLSLIMQIGLTILVPTVGLLFLGIYLDKLWGTGFLIWIGIFLGLSGGITGAWNLLKKRIPKDTVEEEYDLMKNWRDDTDGK